MSQYINLNIITPNKHLYSGEVRKIVTEDINGKIEILPKHISMITILKPTITKFVDKEDKEFIIFTSSGILNISDNNLSIACDAAEFKQDIDFERAKEAKERAEERLANKSQDIDVKRAEAALLRALTRLKLQDL